MRKFSKDFVDIMLKITNLSSQAEFECYIKKEPIVIDNITFKAEHKLIISYTSDGYPCRDNLDNFVKNYITLPGSHKTRFIDAVNNHFNISPILDTDKLEVWPSNKIRYAYLSDNYYECCGPLGTSCMRSKVNQKALNFYVKNNVEIVVLITKENKIKARALLWKGIYKTGCKNKTFTYLDRVYYSREKQTQIYDDFVKKHKYLSYVALSGLYIKDIDLQNITHLPYTDTFRYLFYKDRVLSNKSRPKFIKNPDKVLELCHIGNNYGYRPELDKHSIREVFTNNWVSKKDCIFVSRYKKYVSKDNAIKIGDTYYSAHDSTYIYCLDSDKQEYCLQKDVVEEAFTNLKINKKKSKLIDKYSGYVSRENIIRIGNKPYSKFDTCIVEYKNKYYLISNCYKGVLSDSYIPKNKAIVAYRLGFKNYTNRFITKLTLFGTDTQHELADTEHSDKVVELIGPYYIDLDETPCLVLNTGEYIIKDPPPITYTKDEELRRSCLIKEATVSSSIIRRNKKNYLRHLYEFKDKKQLEFSFMKR